jgi:hypothetical protein
VVFVEVASNGQTQNLVLADPEAPGAPRRRALCECAGFTAASVSPDGSRIAVLTRDKKQLTEQVSGFTALPFHCHAPHCTRAPMRTKRFDQCGTC